MRWDMNEEQRRAIVENGPMIYLHDGLRAQLAGILNPGYCTVTSARPGFWACSWERVAEVQGSESKRFNRFDLHRTSTAWLGCTPRPEDYQTPEDYEIAHAMPSDGRE
jgi:hypothetical protein